MISFVIPLCNHLGSTKVMFDSLIKSLPLSLNYEVRFVDDASSDLTPVWVASLNDHRVKYLTNNDNLGYAASNNAGVDMAQGEFLVLLNNDLVLTHNWIDPMLSILQKSQLNAGLVGNVQYRIEDGKLDHAGFLITPFGQFDHLRIIPELPFVNCLAVTGACILLRKSDFVSLGGFDEGFINGCEDIDLCFRMKASKKIYIWRLKVKFITMSV